MDSDSTYVDLGLSLSDTSLAAPTIVCAESPECPFRDRSERNEISWLQLSEIEANVSGHGVKWSREWKQVEWKCSMFVEESPDFETIHSHQD